MVLVAVELMTKILQYSLFANFLFANRENLVEFSVAQGVGSQQKHHIHI